MAAGVEPASALVNLWIFLLLYSIGMAIEIAAPAAFIVAAAANYLLSVIFVFRHKAKWGTILEIIIYCVVVLIGATLDLVITKSSVNLGSPPGIATIIATALLISASYSTRYVRS